MRLQGEQPNLAALQFCGRACGSNPADLGRWRPGDDTCAGYHFYANRHFRVSRSPRVQEKMDSRLRGKDDKLAFRVRVRKQALVQGSYAN